MKIFLCIICVVILLAFGLLPASAADSSDTPEDVLKLVRDGQKIQAIKAYRRIYRVGLKDAKDKVDELFALHKEGKNLSLPPAGEADQKIKAESQTAGN